MFVDHLTEHEAFLYTSCLWFSCTKPVNFAGLHRKLAILRNKNFSLEEATQDYNQS